MARGRCRAGVRALQNVFSRRPAWAARGLTTGSFNRGNERRDRPGPRYGYRRAFDFLAAFLAGFFAADLFAADFPAVDFFAAGLRPFPCTSSSV
jgi:hypothetical protein